MAKLFIRPSQVVTRLREIYDTIQVKYPTFPDLTVLAAADSTLQEELGDSDSTLPEETTLYVANGISSATDTGAGSFPVVQIEHGITILWIIGTRDEHAQYSEELSTLIKEFVLIALHGFEWDEGQEPLTFTNESFFRVKGKALYLRSLDFSHPATLTYEDVDDSLGIFDDLEDFLLLQGLIQAKLTPQDDIAEIEVKVDLPGPS